MLLCDHQLFLVRVGAELDDLHAVEQRTRDGVRRVRRGDEHALAQVKRQFKEIVAEGRVLLGVQHFQQRGRGVAAIVAAQLVDLIEQQERIFASRLLDGRQDSAGHRADIGLAVAADLRLVVDAAEGDTRELPVERAGDAHGNGRLAHARRADQTDDLPRQLRRKLLDRQYFQDPFLDLFQTEVVLIQNFARGAHVAALLRAGVPRQLQRHIQIIPDDGGLRRAEGLLHQALQFLVEFFSDLLRKRQLFDFLAVFVEFRLVVALAQLIADDLHLLAQEIVALTLVDVLLGLILKLVFHAQNLQLMRKELVGDLQTAHGVPLLQNAHLLGKAVGRALAHQVGDIAGVVGCQNFQHRLLYGTLRQIRKLVKKLRRLPHQRLDLRRALHILRIRDGLHTRTEIGIGLLDLRHLCAALAHDQNAHGVARHFQHLPHLRDRADRIEIVKGRIVLQNILLCYKKDALIAGHGLVQCADRLLASDVKVHRRPGKHR